MVESSLVISAGGTGVKYRTFRRNSCAVLFRNGESEKPAIVRCGLKCEVGSQELYLAVIKPLKPIEQQRVGHIVPVTCEQQLRLVPMHFISQQIMMMNLGHAILTL